MKFRKKPVVIEATQWFKAGDHPAVMGANPNVMCGCVVTRGEDAAKSHIHTREGPMGVSAGDWIITGVKGEHYACKPDIFDMTYEPA